MHARRVRRPPCVCVCVCVCAALYVWVVNGTAVQYPRGHKRTPAGRGGGQRGRRWRSAFVVLTFAFLDLGLCKAPVLPEFDFSSPVPAEVDGVLFHAIIVDVLQHKVREKVLALTIEMPHRADRIMIGFQKIALKFNVLLFRLVHILVTIVIWQHHFYLKYRLQEGKLAKGPDVIPNYYWKLLVPPIEFGAMHAILFQLALIPLTVSKGLLAWISVNTSGLPMQHMITFHIHLGYTFCIVMVLSVILFFTFFGKVCTDFKNGDDKLDTCEKFTDEIMITGSVPLPGRCPC